MFSLERMISQVMHWLWRVLVVLLLVLLLRNMYLPQQQAFIFWPQAESWQKNFYWEILEIQKGAQDLPTSLEIEIRRLFQEFQPTGEGKSV